VYILSLSAYYILLLSEKKYPVVVTKLYTRAATYTTYRCNTIYDATIIRSKLYIRRVHGLFEITPVIDSGLIKRRVEKSRFISAFPTKCTRRTSLPFRHDATPLTSIHIGQSLYTRWSSAYFFQIRSLSHTHTHTHIYIFLFITDLL